jgi:hypothetical protein
MTDTVKLEKRIAAAISNGNAGSAELSELVSEVELAQITATAIAEREREKAVDILSSSDIEAAHKAVVAAELARDRLKAILPRLKDKLAISLVDETKARHAAHGVRLQTKIEEVATQFRDTYSPAVKTILELFVEIRELEAEVSMHSAQAPPGAQHLRGPELTARGMASFSTTEPSVLVDTVLVDPSNSAKLWPPKAPPISTLVSLPIIPGPGPDWRAGLQQEAQRRRQEWEAVVADHQRRAEEQGEKEKEELQRRIEKDQLERRQRYGITTP